MSFALISHLLFIDTWSEASITIEELRVIVENLRILPRVFEVFEKVANGNLEIALLRTMQLCLKKSSKDAAQLIRRPAFMKKLKATIASSLPKFLHCSISVVSNVVQIGKLLKTQFCHYPR